MLTDKPHCGSAMLSKLLTAKMTNRYCPALPYIIHVKPQLRNTRERGSK